MNVSRREHVDLIGPGPVEGLVPTVPDARTLGHFLNDPVAGCDGIVVVFHGFLLRVLLPEFADARTIALVHIDDSVGPDDEHRAASGSLRLIGVDLRSLVGVALGKPEA